MSPISADSFAKQSANDTGELGLFYGFEPWDPALRSDKIIEYARKWNVKLARDPGLFQSGTMTSDGYLTLSQGGNQIGKSYPCIVRIIIELTGSLPLAYRYDKGVDTGRLRDITEHNIKRFGRHSTENGRVLDYNPKVPISKYWHCGTVIGAGKYPAGLIPDRGQKIWVCTFKQALEEMWWPDFKMVVPDSLVNTRIGNKGYSMDPRRAYLEGGQISFITYEQGYQRTEAKQVYRIYLDEEPPDRRFYLGCVEHAVYLSMMFTPIMGLSWSYNDIYKPAMSGKDPNITIYHATQFDCPWRLYEKIVKKIGLLKPWEVEARVFGMYSEQRGKPYFDRDRINIWIRRWIPTGHMARMVCDIPWTTMTQLLASSVKTQTVTFEDHQREQDSWEIYEFPKEKTPYWVSVDTSQGQVEGLESEDVLDRNVAYVWRFRSEEHGDDVSIEDPILCAACRSILKTIPFSRVVIEACHWYNNALMCAESRGESGATFLAFLSDYPFWLKMTVINQSARKEVSKMGFDTTVNHRQQALDLVGDWIDRRPGNVSNIPHHPLLKELAEAVVGKGGRPDHTTEGTLDCAMSMGIGLWVGQYARLQIHDNSAYSPKRDTSSLPGGIRPFTVPQEQPKHLGSRGNRSCRNNPRATSNSSRN